MSPRIQYVQVDARWKPLNFGAVLPGSVYRSSFPAPENLPFLGTLGLKTILLVLPYHALQAEN
jgi:protein tyrosine/serine phosphatase